MGSTFPDYYSILGVTSTATPAQVKSAYYKRSLEAHPDRIKSLSPEVKRAATEEFQSIADAYYTLSDADRRRNYDHLRSARQPSSSTASGSSSASSFADFFKATGETRPDSDTVFGDAFEEMLRPEVGGTRAGWPFWKYIGGLSGAGLGFILGNVVGAGIGGIAGSKLGSIRDVKGKAVYESFKELGSDQKAEILKGLMAKVLAMAASRVS